MEVDIFLCLPVAVVRDCDLQSKRVDVKAEESIQGTEQGIKSQESVLDDLEKQAGRATSQNEATCIPLLQLIQQLLRSAACLPEAICSVFTMCVLEL